MLEKIMKILSNASCKAIKPKGVPGKHTTLIFFLCRIFPTARWGSITALSLVALRAGMREQFA
jgi:hypothetical protein